jgi:hypothetical protein
VLILPATARKKKGSEPIGAGQNLLLFTIESTVYIALELLTYAVIGLMQ